MDGFWGGDTIFGHMDLVGVAQIMNALPQNSFNKRTSASTSFVRSHKKCMILKNRRKNRSFFLLEFVEKIDVSSLSPKWVGLGEKMALQRLFFEKDMDVLMACTKNPMDGTK